MIEIRSGDLLSVTEGILVQGCNCRGVMGSGLADQARKKWPDIFRYYMEAYQKAGLHLGQVIPVYGSHFPAEEGSPKSSQLPPDVIFVNAMTQFNYGRNKNIRYASYDAIRDAFTSIRTLAEDYRLPVHIPQIGCGLANGSWSEVAPIIETALGNDIKVTLWNYGN